jgi:hypothetical protein
MYTEFILLINSLSRLYDLGYPSLQTLDFKAEEEISTNSQALLL